MLKGSSSSTIKDFSELDRGKHDGSVGIEHRPRGDEAQEESSKQGYKIAADDAQATIDTKSVIVCREVYWWRWRTFLGKGFS